MFHHKIQHKLVVHWFLHKVLRLNVQFKKGGRGLLQEALRGEGECPPGWKGGLRRQSIGPRKWW